MSIHSDLWHRVAALKPRLKPDIVVSRQVVRGEVWYVAANRLMTRSCRFTPAVWSVLMRLDGRRTLQRVWQQVVEDFGAEAPGQDDIINVVSQLYAAELVASDASVDEAELSERSNAHARQIAASRYRNPMFLRWRLFDPDRALEASLHLVRPLCSPLGGILWLAAMAWFLAEIAQNWDELSADVTDRVLAVGNLITFILVFPLLKVLHELGHAYAVKLQGGEVHEIGISFLTFMPAPYVDASAALMFAERWRRALVGAAGMIVELADASAALFVWLNAEPGQVRSIAYDIVFIGSVSTVIFNANPLLRFDGYYILCDLLDLPNLALRSQRLYLAFVQRRLFGQAEAVSPRCSPRERPWLLLYGPASLAYRLTVVTTIALVVGAKYFFFGVALVIWMVAAAIVWPLLKGLYYVLLSPALTGRRLRAVAVMAVAVTAVAGGVAFVPVPYGTVVEGVVWVPDNARVVVEAAGQVAEFLSEPGARVSAGAPLIRIEDPFIESKKQAATARLTELRARLIAAEPVSPFETQLVRNQVAFAEQDLAETVRREEALLIRSSLDGTFIVPRGHDLDGAYVKQGEVVAYVMSGAAPAVRATVPEDEIEPVRTQTQGVAVRLEGAVRHVIADARIAREFPAETHDLPSLALAAENGGPFPLDPADKDRKRSLFPFFNVDIEVPSVLARDHWGERAWIRFDYGAAPLLGRWWRSVRQLFLGHFHV